MMDLVDLLDTTPTTILVGGNRKHLWCDGTITPVVSGGDGPEGGGGGSGSGGGDGGQGGDAFRPITSQDELNRVVQDRIRRAREEALKGVPTGDELEELRRKAKAHDDAEAANQSELERERTRADEAEKQARAAAERAERVARRSAIIAEASKAGAVDPEVVADLLASTNAVTIDDAGQVTGADTAVQTLLTEKPFLAATGGTGSVDTGQGRDRGDRGGKPSGLAAGRERYEQRHGTTK